MTGGTVELGVGIQGNNIQGQLADFEALVGPVGVTRHYQNWSEPLIDDDIRATLAAGRTPLIFLHAFDPQLNAVRWADIAAGRYDAELQDKAQELIALGDVRVYFGFHHEPEDDVDEIGSQGKCGEAADFVRAWARVKKVLRNAGVKGNVRIGLTLMGATYRNATKVGGHGGPDLWCPTTIKPNWIGTDGYNRGQWDTPPKWRTFAEVFDAAQAFVLTRGVPFIIQECGCAEGAPGDKAAWFDDAAQTMKRYGNLAVFMYSHVFSFNYGCNYMVDTSDSSLAAFKRLVAGL